MKLKALVTAALLTFVAVSLAVAVADVAGLRRSVPTAPAEPPSSGERVVVYYFHSATRCKTCRAIESYARDAIAPRAESGAVEWRLVNYEEPANQHLATRFDLACPSVVLVRFQAGEVVRWKTLERTWELFDDRAASIAYVRSELAAFTEDRP